MKSKQLSLLENETIAALATPPGRGGIAIVRVSGPLVVSLMTALFGEELKIRKASYVSFKDADGSSIDEGIAIYFQQPHSFTGEDVLELHGHGGPVVIDLLLQRLLSLGVRLANPGEFSERAFLNGKMDLAQAEAVADLIKATSVKAARSAMRSLQGEFSREILELTNKVTHLRMYIEAAIDFSDEAIDFLNDEKITTQLTELLTDLTRIKAKAKQGSFLREGITAVIAGEPNAGKSSLLNCLIGKEAAIVTATPGTTRDVLREHIHIDGMPMHIIDTAGLRESQDEVEQEGIRRAYQEIEQADIVLYVIDITRTTSVEEKWLNKQSAKIIYLYNKIDLVDTPNKRQHLQGIFISARTGEGIETLKHHIKSAVGFDSESEGIFLARRRHLDALHSAYRHIKESINQLMDFQRGELAAEELRLAQQALAEITGEFTADDLLGRIFSSFCIGK